MRVDVDARWSGMGGIGRFYKEVTTRLNCFRAVYPLGSAASIFSPITIAWATLKMRNALFFSPGYIPPLVSYKPFIFTIHDLNHLDRKENGSLLKTLFYQIIIRRGCTKAAKILTVSEFSKNRIIEWSGVSSHKVVNVGNGVDTAFNITVPMYQPGYSYLLCVSNRKLHKNELHLIQAFAKANIDFSIKLFFTGDKSAELEKLINELSLTDRIVFGGKITEKALPSLYRGALALTFPSLYEGFGLPVVEAMACGIPVITSNVTSLPEVAGDAALLVDPESLSELSVAIENIVQDEDLRNTLSARGLIQAKKFNWDDVAARVQKVLDDVMKEHNA